MLSSGQRTNSNPHQTAHPQRASSQLARRMKHRHETQHPLFLLRLLRFARWRLRITICSHCTGIGVLRHIGRRLGIVLEELVGRLVRLTEILTAAC